MIDIQNLTKSFGGKTVLNDISFSVKPGEVFGYLGPNGAGKTTTMRIILGLLRPTSGTALVNGCYLGDSREARVKVGVLLDQDGLYERITAYENLDYFARLYGIRDSNNRIGSLLQFVGLSGERNQKVGTFSKGMKRKLGLARAILHTPKVLFLDEPSAGLDPEAQLMVRELIKNLSGDRGMTIFLNSHDLDEVQRICSSIAILKDGEIKACGAMPDLMGTATGQAVEIVLSDDTDRGQACSLLSALDYVADCSQSEKGITAVVKEGAAPSQLLNYLVSSGISVEEIKKVSRSLEDLYLDTVHAEGRDE
jgi:ABC-2 type transport system ATP-binding protein